MPSPAAPQGSSEPGSSPSAATPDAGGAPAQSSPDAGAGSDAGTTPVTPSANAFTGASAYVAGTGATTRKEEHPNGGDPAGVACFSCHGKGAPQMVMGGTVYADAAGTTPLSQVEVRLLVGGTARTVYTNQDGNFFVLGPSLSGAAMVGVRNGAGSHVMNGAPVNGDCNGCHNGTTASRIHLP